MSTYDKPFLGHTRIAGTFFGFLAGIGWVGTVAIISLLGHLIAVTKSAFGSFVSMADGAAYVRAVPSWGVVNRRGWDVICVGSQVLHPDRLDSTWFWFLRYHHADLVQFDRLVEDLPFERQGHVRRSVTGHCRSRYGCCFKAKDTSPPCYRKRSLKKCRGPITLFTSLINKQDL